jgi:hypothetical protein
LGLQVGDTFAGLHGLGAGGHSHGNTPYTVVGVLQGNGSVLDRLVLTATESVWAVHETDMAVDDDDRAALEAEREITLALIRYNTPLAAVTFPRFVNTTTEMQAAAPAYELSRLLCFLPVVASSDKPMVKPRGGLRSVGLPYAQDAAITRHLAGFLSKQRDAAVELTGLSLPEQAGFLHPTALLFNGGVFKAAPLAERLLAVVNQWLSEESAAPARVLAGADLDLAVARGAAYYGYVRQGKGVRIKGGTAAAYYVGVESAMPAVPGLPPEIEALCIAPFGMEEGSEQVLPNAEFGLVVGEPVRFRFFASKTRRDDAVGLRLETWSDDALQELDEIEVTLPEEGRQSGEVVPVQLSAAVSDIGTLELRAISRRDQQQWKIEFDVRHSEN